MGALLEMDVDAGLVDGDRGRGIDEVAENMAGMSAEISVLNLEGKESVETAGHQSEQEITIDLHGDGGGESIHVEEIDAVGNAIFDDHALGVALNQLGSGTAQLVGQQEGGLLMAEVGDDDLAERSGVAGQSNTLIENAWCAVFPGDVV